MKNKLFLYLFIFCFFSLNVFATKKDRVTRRKRLMEGYIMVEALSDLGFDKVNNVFNGLGGRLSFGFMSRHLDLRLSLDFLYEKNYTEKYNDDFYSDNRDTFYSSNNLEKQYFEGFVFDFNPMLKFKYGISRFFDLGSGIGYKYRMFSPVGNINAIHLHGISLNILDVYVRWISFLLNSGFDLDFMFAQNTRKYNNPSFRIFSSSSLSTFDDEYKPSKMNFYANFTFRIGVGFVF